MGFMKLIFTNRINLVSLKQFHQLPRFVMKLLQWDKVYKIAEDELHRPPPVALNSGQIMHESGHL